MSNAADRSSKRVLDPIDRVTEVLFGLIMVLTFTGSLSVAEAGREDVRTMLIGALGCNLAWGIIDGAMHVMNSMFSRGRRARIFAELKRSGESGALAIIARELGPRLADLTTEAERSRLYRSVLTVAARTPVERTGLDRDEIYAGLVCAALVFATALPAAVPFMVFGDPFVALRVSNAILVGMLFGVGYFWASHTNANRIAAGFAMMGVGLVLVVGAMALGG